MSVKRPVHSSRIPTATSSPVWCGMVARSSRPGGGCCRSPRA